VVTQVAIFARRSEKATDRRTVTIELVRRRFVILHYAPKLRPNRKTVILNLIQNLFRPICLFRGDSLQEHSVASLPAQPGDYSVAPLPAPHREPAHRHGSCAHDSRRCATTVGVRNDTQLGLCIVRRTSLNQHGKPRSFPPSLWSIRGGRSGGEDCFPRRLPVGAVRAERTVSVQSSNRPQKKQRPDRFPDRA